MIVAIIIGDMVYGIEERIILAIMCSYLSVTQADSDRECNEHHRLFGLITNSTTSLLMPP